MQSAECRIQNAEGSLSSTLLRSAICTLGSAFVLLILPPVLTGAQQRSSLVVLVRSSTTDGPLANARVTLTLPSGSDTTVITDTTGRKVFRRLRPGAYTVKATWGELVSQPAVITLADREEIEVQFTVGPQGEMAIRLPELAVTAPAGLRQYMVGFDERRSRGLGQFVTREDIENRGSVSLAELLRSLRGIRVNCRGGLCIPQMLRAPAGCWPKFLLDEMVVDPVFGARLRPQDLEGIEIYEGLSQVPLELMGSDQRETRCGMIVMWSRRPNRRSSPDSSPPPPS